MKTVIEVKNLVKGYGKFRPVDCISFDVKNGEIFTLVGPDGAGKTTTVEILECLIKPNLEVCEFLAMTLVRMRRR